MDSHENSNADGIAAVWMNKVWPGIRTLSRMCFVSKQRYERCQIRSRYRCGGERLNVPADVQE
jgi:hypothetical protein